MAADTQHAPASFADPTSDISAFFSKKKPQRQKKSLLFKFDSSSHAMSINNYLKERRNDIGTKVTENDFSYISLI